jgi:hypothetical protein
VSTHSTVPTVKAQIVSNLVALRDDPDTPAAELAGVSITYAWPGPATTSRAVFLGPHPELADIRLDLTSAVPTIKAGRKQRQEDYPVRVTVWEFRPDLTSDGAQACEDAAFDVAGVIEDQLADDPTLGLAQGVVQYLTVESLASTLFPFQKGWACELAIDVRVRARLT